MSLDLSLDAATLLRQSAMFVHDDVAGTLGAAALQNVELDRFECVRYLMMLWRVYDALERRLDELANNAILVPTYSPAVLARTPALSSDIAHLLQVYENAWPQHPLYTSVLNGQIPSLDLYVARLQSATPAQLLAHAYVRYLGDLSGGQVVRHRVQKAFDLDAESTLGTQFYIFERDGKIANGGELKRIKEWYRNGLNEGVGDDREMKKEMCDEVMLAFRWNKDILIAVRPSTPEPKTSTTSSRVDAGTPSDHRALKLLSPLLSQTQRLLTPGTAMLCMFLAAIILRQTGAAILSAL